MSEKTPEEEMDIEEPTEYTSDPEDVSDIQDDNAEGSTSELTRENDINP